MKHIFFKKIISVIANLSLLLNTLLPFYVVQPIYATDSNQTESTLQYNKLNNKLNISVNSSNKVAYQLFYKTSEKIDAIVGNDLNQANQNDSFYLGTCSANSVCLAQNISRGILKLEFGTNYYSKLFTLENNVLNVVKEIESSQSDLTEEENNFLEKNIVNNWTFEKVELNKEYTASGVTLVFTKLPQNSGNIKIEEITLTSDQIKQTGSLSDKAYDITSDMVDGTFAYNLTLPAPGNNSDKSVAIKFAENISELSQAQTAGNSELTNDSISVKNINHFTVFVVVTPTDILNSLCVGAGTNCFTTIQSAINAASDGDTINVSAGTYNENIIINKPLTLLGANANIPFSSSRVSESIIKDASNGGHPISLGTGLGTENVTINGFEITGEMSNNAIYCGGDGASNLTINYNYIHNIGTARGSNNVYAINYRVNDPSSTNINISDNYISNIFNSNNSALGHSAAIWIGQSTAKGVVNNLKIERNIINNVYSGLANKDSSGIYIGVAWGTGTGKVEAPSINNNIITNISGGNAYGIQLSGKTPNAVITNNIIDSINNGSLGTNIAYGIAIPDTNTGAGTITINQNKLSNVLYGVWTTSTNLIDATKNWWGHSTGPNDSKILPATPNYNNLTGQGTKVTSNVDYKSWYTDTEMTALYTAPTYNGSVSGIVTSDNNGVVSGTLNGDYHLTILGQVTAYTNNSASFSGTVSGDINGTITASINSNGIDTMSGTITGTNAELPVRIIGIFPKTGTDGDFSGKIITGLLPTYVNSMSINSENNVTSVEAGKTLQMSVIVSPSEASSEVAWSLWSSPENSDDIATIDQNGLLTGKSFGTVTVIAKALDGSLKDATKIINVTPDITAPAVPVHSSPSNNSFINYNDFWFEWNAVNDAVSYEMQNSTDPRLTSTGSFQNVMWTGDYQRNQPIVPKARSVGANGTWYWQVRSVDATGNKSAWSVPWKITIDKVAPTKPVFISPQNNIKTNINAITLKWNGGDDTSSGVKGYIFRYVFNPANGGNPINWSSGFVNTTSKTRSGSFGHGQGTYTMFVKTIDNSGNESQESDPLIITYDATAPIITLDAYTTTLTNQNITVTAHTNEGNLNIGSTTFTTNGSFTFTAVDNAGNTSTKPVSINNIDKTAPTVDITFPNNGDILKGNVTISGKIVDDNPHHYYLVIQNSQGNVITGPGTVYQTNVSNWIWDTTKVSDGTYIIDLEARDAANNKDINSTKKITVTVNNIAPDAPSLIGDLITYIKPGNVIRSWNKSNSSDVVSYIYKSFTSEAYANDPDNSPSWTPTPINANGQDIYSRTDPTGDYERVFWWRVAAVDTAGNKTWSNDIHKIVVDKTAPTLKNKTIFSDSWYKNDLTSTFTYTDTNGVVSGNNLTCDITTEGSSQTCSITPNVCDAAGNCNTTTVISNSANLDKTTPISTIDGGENKDTIYSNSWNGSLSGTATDDLSGVAGVQISIKNGSGKYYSGSEFNQDSEFLLDTVYNNSIGIWTYSGLTNPLEDSYTVNSHATDNANNLENTYTLTIILDKTISEVGISLNPTDPDTSNGWYKTQPEVTLTQTDINFDKIEYQWDSQTGNWTTYLNSFKPTSQGSHILYYRAVDKAGNISTVGIKNIKWDNTELEFGPQNISANPNPTSGSTSKITWETAKDNNGIDKYEIQWTLNNSSENKSYSKTVDSNTYETEIDQLIEGRWTIKVIAYDASGKSRDNSIDLVVDRTAPIAPTLTLTNTGTGTASLSWNAVSDAKDYIVWYGNSSGEHLYGARVGNVTSYTVKGLGSGNYYFSIKSVDSAQNQSGYSNEVNTGNITGAIGTTPNQPAQGFTPEVLGTSTETQNENQNQNVNSGDVLGATNASTGQWFPLLFILAFLINIFYLRRNNKLIDLIPFVISSAAFLTDWLLLKKYGSSISWLGQYFWIGNILSWLIPTALNRKSSIKI